MFLRLLFSYIKDAFELSIVIILLFTTNNSKSKAALFSASNKSAWRLKDLDLPDRQDLAGAARAFQCFVRG